MKWLEFIKGARGGLERDRRRTHGTMDKAARHPSLTEDLVYHHASVPSDLEITPVCKTDRYESRRTELALRIAPEL